VRAGAYAFLRHMTGYDLPPDLQPWREALGLAAVP